MGYVSLFAQCEKRLNAIFLRYQGKNTFFIVINIWITVLWAQTEKEF